MRGIIIAATLVFTTGAHAADCGKALFGWTAKDGTHISGTLSNEGVSKKNPRGFQCMEADSGNWLNGKLVCTAYGLAGKYYPKVNMRTVTKEKAIQIYHDNQWSEIKGDRMMGQYLAYKVFDLATNTGTGTAIRLYGQTAAGLGYKGKVGTEMTPELVDWVNAFTEDSLNRRLFKAELKLRAMSRYIDIAQAKPKQRQFLLTWAARDVDDE